MWLSHKWKLVGWNLVLLGSALGIIYLKFDFSLRLPVFAVFSSFLETRMFVSFKTNVSDDLILFLLVSGFGILLCSKEKDESELLDKIRVKAFMKAFLANTLLLLFTILFVFGAGFMGVLVINLFSFSLFYLLFFYLGKRKLH
jgi:hypothetical protein